MIHDVTASMAGLVGFWCTTLLYGINLVVYFSCITILLKRKSAKASVTAVLLGTATVQFMLSTTYLAIGLRMLIEGFIWAASTLGASNAYWNDVSSPLQVASKGTYITNSLIGDSILVWRLYVVWGNNVIICILPILIVIGTAVCGYAAVADLARLDPTAGPNALFAIANWILGAWSLSIATQILVTLAIAGRIYWMSRGTSLARGASKRYMSVIWIIVESGAIYSITTIFLLAFFDLQTQAGGVIGACLAQICAIVPTLIIVRVGMGQSFQSQNSSQASDLTLPVPKPMQVVKLVDSQQSLDETNHELSTKESGWVAGTSDTDSV